MSLPYIKKESTSSKVYIYPQGRPTSIAAVEAPMPEQYGIGIGGEVTAPFSDLLSDNSLISKYFLLKGITAQYGLFTRKVWSGPEQPDISFMVQFDAYLNAADDVVLPVWKLMSMAVGRLDNSPLLKKIEQDLTKAKNFYNEVMGFSANAVTNISNTLAGPNSPKPGQPGNSQTNQGGANLPIASTVSSVLQDLEISPSTFALLAPGFLRAPPKVNVRFGQIKNSTNTGLTGVFSLVGAYLTEVSPKFSNHIDINGFPMHAEVDLTFSLEQPLNSQSLGSVFSGFTNPGF